MERRGGTGVEVVREDRGGARHVMNSLKIFERINTTTRYKPGRNRTREERARDHLSIHPGSSVPPATATLYSLAWRYIITDFYRVHYDGYKFSVNAVLARTLNAGEIRTLEQSSALRERGRYFKSQEPPRRAREGSQKKDRQKQKRQKADLHNR